MDGHVTVGEDHSVGAGMAGPEPLDAQSSRPGVVNDDDLAAAEVERQIGRQCAAQRRLVDVAVNRVQRRTDCAEL